MAKIVKNNTGSPLTINDTGVTIPASGQHTITTGEEFLWAASSDLVTELGNNNATINDGTSDLSDSDGLDLIKGIFPKKIQITDGTDIADIIDDAGTKRLAVDAEITGDSGNTVRDFFLEVQKGNIPGHSAVDKFGHNPSVDAQAFEDIWDAGGSYVFPTTARLVDLVSTDNNDSFTGTGAKQVRIFGLDANWLLQEETINLNGTTTVTTANTYIRLFRMKIVGDQDLIGNLTATSQVDSILLAQILGDDQDNQTLMAIYTIPAGKTGYLVSFFYTLKTGKATALDLQVREFGGVFQNKRKLVTDEAYLPPIKVSLTIPEKSDIKIRAKASTGSHEVSGGFSLILVDN